MVFEYDENKNQANIGLGRSQKEQTLFVVHCYRIKEDEEEIIRIISAREVTKFEKKSLEEL